MLKKNWFIIVGTFVMLIVITIVIAEMTNPSRKCSASCQRSKECLTETASVDGETTKCCKKDACQSDCKKKDCKKSDCAKTSCEKTKATSCINEKKSECKQAAD